MERNKNARKSTSTGSFGASRPGVTGMTGQVPATSLSDDCERKGELEPSLAVSAGENGSDSLDWFLFPNQKRKKAEKKKAELIG